MPRLTKYEKLMHCYSCEDNFYNGNNDLGVKECWRLKDAKLVKRKQVSMSQVPPWTQKPILVLSCFRMRGYVFVEPNRTY